MDLGVAGPVVGLLVVHDTLAADRDEPGVGVVGPRLGLDRHRGHDVADPAHALHEVVGADLDAVLAADEQQVLEPPAGQQPGLRGDVVG